MFKDVILFIYIYTMHLKKMLSYFEEPKIIPYIRNEILKTRI